MIIPKTIAPRVPDTATGQIPRIIHQTFETADVPQGMYDASQSWVTLNPQFTYRFHDRDDRRAFLAAHFPAEVGAAYDKLKNGAFRADLWRYCVLAVEGGVYADIDSVAQAPLLDLIGAEDSFIVARAGALTYALFNGFICTQPGHPFLTAAVDRATQAIHAAGDRPIDGFLTTGPGNLGCAVNGVLGRPEQTAFDYGLQSGPTSDPGGDWRIIHKSRQEDGNPYVSQEDRIFLYCDYDGYRDDLAARDVQHWQDQRHETRRKPNPVRRLIKRSIKRLLGRL